MLELQFIIQILNIYIYYLFRNGWLNCESLKLAENQQCVVRLFDCPHC